MKIETRTEYNMMCAVFALVEPLYARRSPLLRLRET